MVIKISYKSEHKWRKVSINENEISYNLYNSIKENSHYITTITELFITKLYNHKPNEKWEILIFVEKTNTGSIDNDEQLYLAKKNYFESKRKAIYYSKEFMKNYPDGLKYDITKKLK